MPMTAAEQRALRHEQRTLKRGNPAAEPTPEVDDDGAPAPTPEAAPDEIDYRALYEKTKTEFDALQGRVAPAQRDAQLYRGLYETAEQKAIREREASEARIRELNEELATARSKKDIANIQEELESLLDPEELELIEPTVIKAMAKVSQHMFARNQGPDPRKAVEEILQAREAQSVKNYRDEIVTSKSGSVFGRPNETNYLNDLPNLVNNNDFKAYLEENPTVELTLNAMFAATNANEVKKYAVAANKLVGAFKESKTPNGGADPKGSILDSAMRRQPAKQSLQDDVAELQKARSMLRSRDRTIRAKGAEIIRKFQK